MSKKDELLYEDLINKAKSEPREKYQGQYYENHHVLPKSLGGSDDLENLVLLTPEEHFQAHYLLSKMFTKDQWQYEPMLRAFMMMNCSNDSHEYRYVDAELFGEGRRKWSAFMVENNPAKRQEVRNKISVAQSNKIMMSKSGVNKWVEKEEYQDYLNKGWTPGMTDLCTENRKGSNNGMSKTNRDSMWVKNENQEKSIRKGDLEFYKAKGFTPGRLPSPKGSKSKMGRKNPGAKFYAIYDRENVIQDIMIRVEIINSEYPDALAKSRNPIFMTQRVQSIGKIISSNGEESYEKYKGYRTEEVSHQEAEDFYEARRPILD